MATPNDATSVREIYRPYVESSAISFEVTVPETQEMATRIQSVLPTYPWLIAEDADDVLGYAYAHPFASRAAYQWSVETSIYVRTDSQGRGVGKALLSALLEILRAQRFAEAFAGIALPNEKSVRLHEALGFVPVALYRRVGWKRGAWHDVQWWQCTIDDTHGVHPFEPIALRELDASTVQQILTSKRADL